MSIFDNRMITHIIKKEDGVVKMTFEATYL